MTKSIWMGIFLYSSKCADPIIENKFDKLYLETVEEEEEVEIKYVLTMASYAHEQQQLDEYNKTRDTPLDESKNFKKYINGGPESWKRKWKQQGQDPGGFREVQQQG